VTFNSSSTLLAASCDYLKLVTVFEVATGGREGAGDAGLQQVHSMLGRPCQGLACVLVVSLGRS